MTLDGPSSDQREHWKEKVLFFAGGGVVTAGLLLGLVLLLEPRTAPEPAALPLAPSESSAPQPVADRKADHDPALSFYRALGEAEPDPVKFMKLPGLSTSAAPVPVVPPVAPKRSPPPRPEPIAAVSPAPRPTPAPVRTEGEFLVQVAAYSSSDAAQALVLRLQGKGYRAAVAPKTATDRQVWYRVRIGPYADRAGAEAVLAEVHRREGLSGMVLRERG